jgi:hypothetical protein
MPITKPLLWCDYIRVAGAAGGIDPRGVKTYFEKPEPRLRPATKHAIRTALAKLGLPDPNPQA